MLIEAIKEQQIQIESLQSEVKNCCEVKNTTKSLKSTSISTSTNDTDNVLTKNSLYQNSPNPFTENTQIRYFIADEAKNAMLCIFDMQGTLLKSYQALNKGNGEITINGGDFNAGMYMYSLIIDGVEIDTKRMILTK